MIWSMPSSACNVNSDYHGVASCVWLINHANNTDKQNSSFVVRDAGENKYASHIYQGIVSVNPMLYPIFGSPSFPAVLQT